MTRTFRNIILLISITFLSSTYPAHGKTAPIEALQKCQLKGAQSLIKKYKLSALPLKIKKPEACGKSFCALFEVIRRGSFKGNLLPIGTTIYACDGRGVQNIKRSDSKGLAFEHGLECKGSVEFSSGDRMSCTLNKPFTIQGFVLPVETEINCLKDYKSLTSFHVKTDVDLNGNKLKANGFYTLIKGQVEESDSEATCDFTNK